MSEVDVVGRLSDFYETSNWKEAEGNPELRAKFEDVLSEFQLENTPAEHDTYLQADADTQARIREGLRDARVIRYGHAYSDEEVQLVQAKDAPAEETPTEETGARSVDDIDLKDEGDSFSRIETTDWLEFDDQDNQVILGALKTRPLTSTGSTSVSSAHSGAKHLKSLQKSLKKANEVSSETLAEYRTLTGLHSATLESIRGGNHDDRVKQVIKEYKADAGTLDAWEKTPVVEAAIDYFTRQSNERFDAEVLKNPEIQRAQATFQSELDYRYGPTSVSSIGEPRHRDHPELTRLQGLKEMRNIKALMALGARDGWNHAMARRFDSSGAVFQELVPIVGTASKLFEYRQVDTLLRRDFEAAERGEDSPLSEYERVKVMHTLMEFKHQVELGDRGSTKGVNLLIDMVPYMATYGAAGGIATGVIKKGATTQLSKRIAHKTFYKNFRDRLAGKALRAVGRDSLRAGLTLAINPAGVEVEARNRARNLGGVKTEIFQEGVGYDYVQSPTGDVSDELLAAALTVWTENYGEAGSERVMGALRHGTKALRVGGVLTLAQRLKIPEAKAVQIMKKFEVAAGKHPKLVAAGQALKKSNGSLEGYRAALKQVGYSTPMLEVYEEIETAMTQNTLGLGSEKGVDLRRLADPLTYADPTDGGSMEDHLAMWVSLAVPGSPNLVANTKRFAEEFSHTNDRNKRKADAKVGLREAETRGTDLKSKHKDDVSALEVEGEVKEGEMGPGAPVTSWEKHPLAQPSQKQVKEAKARRDHNKSWVARIQARIDALDASMETSTNPEAVKSSKTDRRGLVTTRNYLQRQLVNAEYKLQQSESASNETIVRLKDYLNTRTDEELAKIGRLHRKFTGKGPLKTARRVLSGVTEAGLEKTFEHLRTGLSRITTVEEFKAVVDDTFAQVMYAPKGDENTAILNFLHQLQSGIAPGRVGEGTVVTAADLLHFGNSEVTAFKYRDLRRAVLTAVKRGGEAGGEAEGKKAVASFLSNNFANLRQVDAETVRRLREYGYDIEIRKNEGRARLDPGGENLQFPAYIKSEALKSEDRDLLKTGLIAKFDASEGGGAAVESALNNTLLTVTSSTSLPALKEQLTETFGMSRTPAQIKGLQRQISAFLKANPGVIVEVIPSMLLLNASKFMKGHGYTDFHNAASIAGMNDYDSSRVFLSLDGERIDLLEESIEFVMQENGLRFIPALDAEGKHQRDEAGNLKMEATPDLAKETDYLFDVLIPTFRTLVKRQMEAEKKGGEHKTLRLGSSSVDKVTYAAILELLGSFTDVTSKEQRERRFFEFLSKNMTMLMSEDFRNRSPEAHRYAAVYENEVFRELFEFMLNNTSAQTTFQQYFAGVVNAYLPPSSWGVFGVSADDRSMRKVLMPSAARAADTRITGEAMREVKEEFRDALPGLSEDMPILGDGLEVRQALSGDLELVSKETIRQERLETKTRKGRKAAASNRVSFDALSPRAQRPRANRILRRHFMSYKATVSADKVEFMFSREDYQRILDSKVTDWTQKGGEFEKVLSGVVRILLDKMVPDSVKGHHSALAQWGREYMGVADLTLRTKRERVMALKSLVKKIMSEKNVPESDKTKAQKAPEAPKSRAEESAKSAFENFGQFFSLHTEAEYSSMPLHDYALGLFHSTIQSFRSQFDEFGIPSSKDVLHMFEFIRGRASAQRTEAEQDEFWEKYFKFFGLEAPSFDAEWRLNEAAMRVAQYITDQESDAIADQDLGVSLESDEAAIVEGSEEQSEGETDGARRAGDMTLADTSERAREMRNRFLSDFGLLRSLSQRVISDVLSSSDAAREALKSPEHFEEYLKTSGSSVEEANLIQQMRDSGGFNYNTFVDLYALYHELHAPRVAMLIYKSGRKNNQFVSLREVQPRLEFQLVRRVQTMLFNEMKDAESALGLARFITEAATKMRRSANKGAKEVAEAEDLMYRLFGALFGMSAELMKEIDYKGSEAAKSDLLEGRARKTILSRLLYRGAFGKDFATAALEFEQLVNSLNKATKAAEAKGDAETLEKIVGDKDEAVRNFRIALTDYGLMREKSGKNRGMSYLAMLMLGVKGAEMPLRYTTGAGSQKNNHLYQSPFSRAMGRARTEALEIFGLDTPAWQVVEIDSMIQFRGAQNSETSPIYRKTKHAMPENMTEADMVDSLYFLWQSHADQEYYPQWAGAFGDKSALKTVMMKRHGDFKSARDFYDGVHNALTPAEREVFPHDVGEIIRRAEADAEALGIEMSEERLTFELDYAANLVVIQKQLWGDLLGKFKGYIDLVKRASTALSSGPTLIKELFGKDHLKAVTLADPRMLTSGNEASLREKMGGKLFDDMTEAEQTEVSEWFEKHAEDMTDGFALIPEYAMDRIQRALGHSITDTDPGQKLKLVKAIHSGPTGINKFGATRFGKDYATEYHSDSVFATIWKALEKHNAKALRDGGEPIDIIFFGSTDKAKAKQIQVEAGESESLEVQLFKADFDTPGKQYAPAVDLTGDFSFAKTHDVPLQDFYWLLSAEHAPKAESEKLPLQVLPVLAEFGFPMADLLDAHSTQLNLMEEDLHKAGGDWASSSKTLQGMREDSHPLIALIKRNAFPLESPFTRAAVTFSQAKLLQKDVRLKAMVSQLVEHPIAAPRSAIADYEMVTFTGGAWVPTTDAASPRSRTRLARIDANILGSRYAAKLTAGSEIHLQSKTIVVEEDIRTLAGAEDFIRKHATSFLDMFEIPRAMLRDPAFLSKANNEDGYFNDPRIQVRTWELTSTKGVIVLPGEPVLIQRIPSDNNYSISMTRLQNPVPGGANVIKTSFDRQIKAGPDFDIDKRFAMSLRTGKKGGISAEAKWDRYNKTLLGLVSLYGDSSNFERINNTLDHTRFGDSIKKAKSKLEEADANSLRGVPNSALGSVSTFKANTLGQQGLGRIATAMYGANLMANSKVGFREDFSFDFGGHTVKLNALVGEERNFMAGKDSLGTVLNKYTDHTKLQEIDKLGGDEYTASLIALMLFGNKELHSSEMPGMRNADHVEKYIDVIHAVLTSPEVRAWVEMERTRHQMGGKYEYNNDKARKDWLDALKADPKVETPNEAIWDVLLRASAEMFDVTSATRPYVKMPTTQSKFNQTKKQFGEVLSGKTSRKGTRMIRVPLLGKSGVASSQSIPPLFQPAKTVLDFAEAQIFGRLPYQSGMSKVLQEKGMQKWVSGLDERGDESRHTVGAYTEADRIHYQEAIDQIIVIHGLLRGNFRRYEDLERTLLEDLDTLQRKGEYQDNLFMSSIAWGEMTDSYSSGGVKVKATVEVIVKDAQLSPKQEEQIHQNFQKLPSAVQKDLVLFAVMRYGLNFRTNSGSYLRWVDPATLSGLMPNITDAEDEFRDPEKGSSLYQGPMKGRMTKFIQNYLSSGGHPVYSPIDFNSHFSRSNEVYSLEKALDSRAASARMFETAEKDMAEMIQFDMNRMTEQHAQMEELRNLRHSPMAEVEVDEEVSKLFSAKVSSFERRIVDEFRGKPLTAPQAVLYAAYAEAGGQAGHQLLIAQRKLIKDVTRKYSDLAIRLDDPALDEASASEIIGQEVTEDWLKAALLEYAEYRLSASEIRRKVLRVDRENSDTEKRREKFLKIILAEGEEGRIQEIEDLLHELETDMLMGPRELKYSLHTFTWLEDDDVDLQMPDANKRILLKASRGEAAAQVRSASWVQDFRSRVAAHNNKYYDVKDQTAGDLLLEALTVLLEHGIGTSQFPASLDLIRRNKKLYTFDKTVKNYVAGTETTTKVQRGWKVDEKDRTYVADILDAYIKFRNEQAQRGKTLISWQDALTEARLTWEQSRIDSNLRVGQKDWIPGRANYVMHLFRNDTKKKRISLEAETIVSDSGIRRRESGDSTYHTAMRRSGALPRTWDVTELFSSWARRSTEEAKKRIVLQAVANQADIAGVVPLLLAAKDPNTVKSHYPLIDTKTGWKMLRSLHMQAEQLRAQDPNGKLLLNTDPFILSPIRSAWEQLQELMTHIGDEAMKTLGYRQIKFHTLSNQVTSVWAQRGSAQLTVSHAITSGFEDHLAASDEGSLKQWGWRSLIAFKHGSQLVKTLNVGFSAFHHVALLESYTADYGLNFLKSPMFSVGHFIVHLIKGAKEYRALIDNPEEVAQWAADGLDVTVIPDGYEYGLIDSGFAWAGNFLKRRKGMRKLGQTVLALTNVKKRLDNMLWHGILPVMKIRMATNLFNNLRQDTRLDIYTDASLRNDVSKYVNDALGGQEWGQHAWATPFIRDVMNSSLFAADWTISALRISGVPQLISKIMGLETAGNITDRSDQMLSNPITKHRLTHYWPGFVFNVLLWFPMWTQIAITSFFGGDDEDDEMFVWNNKGVGRFRVDFTPVMRAILGDYGQELDRRYYFSLGKQAREVYHWVKSPDSFVSTLFGKSSVGVRALLLLSGNKTVHLNPDKNWKVEASEIPGELGKMFLPFIAQTLMKDTEIPYALAAFAPISRGETLYSLGLELGAAYRMDRRLGESWEHFVGRIDTAEAKIFEKARANDVPARDVQSRARAHARNELHADLWTMLARPVAKIKDAQFIDTMSKLYLLDTDTKKVRDSMNRSVRFRLDNPTVSPKVRRMVIEAWDDPEVKRKVRGGANEANDRYGRYGRRKTERKERR